MKKGTQVTFDYNGTAVTGTAYSINKDTVIVKHSSNLPIAPYYGVSREDITIAAWALGSIKSDKKAAAARKNGKKGGYPKGRPRKTA